MKLSALFCSLVVLSWCSHPLASGAFEYQSGSGPNDDNDFGYVEGRSMIFTKDNYYSVMHFSYSDSWRVAGNPSTTGQSCSWQILIDGSACPSGDLRFDLTTDSDDGTTTNHHQFGTVEGVCEGLDAGFHLMSVYVSNPVRGREDENSDCFTGYNEQTWTMIAEEVDLNDGDYDTAHASPSDHPAPSPSDDRLASQVDRLERVVDDLQEDFDRISVALDVFATLLGFGDTDDSPSDTRNGGRSRRPGYDDGSDRSGYDDGSRSRYDYEGGRSGYDEGGYYDNDDDSDNYEGRYYGYYE